MALYSRSQICKPFKLSCSRWISDHRLVRCGPPITKQTSCLSLVVLGAKRYRQSFLITNLWKSNSRCMSTVKMPPYERGLFHRCCHGQHLTRTFWNDDQFIKGHRWPYDASRVQGIRTHCQKQKEDTKPVIPSAKASIWTRFKDMYREYWYVLVPVHVVTSIVWYGSFYYIASSGFDLVHFLENMNAPDSIIKPFRNSKAGYFAIAYALYKIATPARYTVTLGGTTLSINYLRKWGYIKPIPNKAAIQQMIKDKRAAFQQGLSKRQADRRARTKEKEENKRSSQGGTKKP